MTLDDARELLKDAPIGSEPSAVNPSLTKGQFTKIMVDWVNSQTEEYGEGHRLRDIFEKRVYQCVLNQRRPRF